MKVSNESAFTDVETPPPASSADTQRIFLVEDHPITRAGFAALIKREPDLEVCGEADNAPTALSLIEKLRPDLVVTDIALKTSNGLELTKNIRALIPDQRVLALSMHDEALYAERALRAGALGYMMKNEAAEKIVPAIRTILSGDVYLSESVKGKLVAQMFSLRKPGRGEPVFPIDTLSDREMEVFELIGNGFATREIAERLNLSTKTIDSYREHLKLKLGVDNGSELVRRAIQWARVDGTMPG